MIVSLPDSRQCPDTGKGIILPPPYKAMPGRPKKERKKQADETESKHKA